MAGAHGLTSNVLPVDFTTEKLTVWTRPLADDEDLRALRKDAAPRWSVQLERGSVFFVPLAKDARAVPGADEFDLKVADNLRLFARLTTEGLMRRFPTYEPLRRKPFVFLGHKQQLMHDAGGLLSIDHPLLSDFRIWPKYSLDARVVDVIADEPFVGITVDLATRWEIASELENLQEAGVDLTGLFIVRREPDDERRPLLGRIEAVEGGRVKMSESTSDSTSVDAASAMLEGRRDAFNRCLRQLLGSKYQRYEDLRDRRMGELLGGPPLLEEVARVAKILGERPLELAQGLTCSVSENSSSSS